MAGKRNLQYDDMERDDFPGFATSKKILRSPQQRKIQEERRAGESTKQSNGIGETGGKVDRDGSEIAEIREIMKDMIKEFREMKKSLTEEMVELRKDFQRKKEEWVEEKKEMRDKIDSLEKYVERSEREKRRNNITIKGLEIKYEGETRTAVNQFLRTELKVEAKVGGVRTLNKGTQAELVVVEMESWDKKREIMQVKNRLKGKRIYIDDDLTRNEREIQKQIRSIAKEEILKGKKVKVGYRKITIEGECFIWDEKQKGMVERMQKNDGRKG